MYISDPCTRYGIGGGCDGECPVLNDGECTIEYELAEDIEWYEQWAIDNHIERALDILSEVKSRSSSTKTQTTADNDFDRAMEILK